MSKVYFTDFRCVTRESPLTKMKTLIKEAGIDLIDFKGKFVAVKGHFGEWGNLGHIRQQYYKVMCDYIKEKGGHPFLTDANTLYVGVRNNALNHLQCAYQNGFNPLCTGVHTIIADGLRGTDERKVPIEGAKHCPAPRIASAIAEADIIISITHSKGHVEAGYGGTFKNIGMGSGSRRGKMEMHSTGIPVVKKKNCVGCGLCVRNCANDGVHLIGRKAVIDESHCLGCGYCFAYCPQNAINCKWDEAKPIMNEKIAEYTKAVLQNKPNFHVNFVQDVSEHCDCKPGNDVGMIPDVGIFASYDPVALDQACLDAINAQPIIANSPAGEAALAQGKHEHEGLIHVDEDNELFRYVHPESDWEAGLNHAVALGLGSREYELVTV